MSQPLPQPATPAIATYQKRKPRISPIKWILGVLGLVAVVLAAMSLGLWLRGGPQPVGPPTIFGAIVFTVLGAILLAVGAALWGLTMLTGALTFNYDKPFLGGFKVRMWVLNLLTGLFLNAGVALMVAPFVATALAGFVPPTALGMVAFFVPFVMAQIFLIWLNMWGALMPRMIRRRLGARGLSDEQLRSGIPVGVSDPVKGSMRTFFMEERDMGMLWITPEQLLYWGDSQDWSINRYQVRQIERVADAGSTAAYAGAAHPVICFYDTSGADHHIRLHVETHWTLTAEAKKLDQLGDQLEAWLGTPQGAVAAS